MKKKKRVIIAFCVIIMLMLRFTGTSFASGASLAFNITGDDSVKQGETISIKVNANEPGLTDGKAIITYDESKLTYQGGKLAYSTEENKLKFVVNSDESGKLIVVWATVDPMEASGTVFTLDFMALKTVENGQSTELDLIVEYANDSKGNSVDMATNGNKDSMTIAIGDKIPGPNPDPDPNPDEKPDPDPGTDPDEKPDPDPGTDPDEKPDPNPGTDPDEKPDPDPGTDPDEKPNPDPGTDSDQNQKPGSDQGTNVDQNQKPDSDQGTNVDQNQNPDSNQGTNVDQNQKPDSDQDKDSNLSQDHNDSDKGDSDAELHSTGGSTSTIMYLLIFAVSTIGILGAVTFGLKARFKGKGE